MVKSVGWGLPAVQSFRWSEVWAKCWQATAQYHPDTRHKQEGCQRCSASETESGSSADDETEIRKRTK